ncbi:MAG: [FeFe] hydrogenase H-cluster radical SAM maturase HydG, partial [Myxococcales bacterium]|nr:[FeFe] hydrogenase H-cluster radical SAM maturase HydG [Myxococcales bacterium]
FQETYHHDVYARVHPEGTRKGRYAWRLDAAARAYDAGLDDFGIGALFGLGDWKFEVLGLVAHAAYLKDELGCGPHTVSIPRLRPALGAELHDAYTVSDDDLLRVIAVPAPRHSPTRASSSPRAKRPTFAPRDRARVSQLDAGSDIHLGGYDEAAEIRQSQQFELGDRRSLDEVIAELLDSDHIPSFCTACYRLNRTGEHFMEFAVPGFIKRFCTPNGLLTLTEYLLDHASPTTRQRGLDLVERKLSTLEDTKLKAKLVERLRRVREDGARDLYF